LNFSYFVVSVDVQCHPNGITFDEAVLAIMFVLQDTVVALQALAEFATLFFLGSGGQQNVTISLTADHFSYKFQAITAENLLILYSVEVNCFQYF
jgi:hypothetical protein